MGFGVTWSAMKKEVGENSQPKAESGQLEQGNDDGVAWLQLGRNSALAGGL